MSKTKFNRRPTDACGKAICYQPESGSAADFYLFRRKGGSPILRKLANSEGVENGITKLQNEVKFIKSLPAFAKFLFPAVLNSHSGRGYYYYDMPFLFAGNTLYRWCMRSSRKTEEITATLANLLQEIDRRLYAEAQQAAPPDFLEVAHIERVRRRLLLAASWSPRLRELIRAENLSINGLDCQPALPILETCGQAAWADKLRPRFVSLTHGDLNAHNILVDVVNPRHFVLIDPRGSLDTGTYREYLYDLGKLYLSFNGFHEMRSGHTRLEWHSERSIKINFNQAAAEQSSLVRRTLHSIVQRWRSSSQIPDPYWEYRLAFSEACHFLADVPCRMHKAQDEVIGTTFYLYGLLLLNRCITHVAH